MEGHGGEGRGCRWDVLETGPPVLRTGKRDGRPPESASKDLTFNPGSVAILDRLTTTLHVFGGAGYRVERG